MADDRGMLSLEAVRTGYGAIEVLHGIDLTIAQGEVVTIIGVNGSGKSTLLKAVSGLIPLWGGGISLAGEALDSLSVEQIVERGVIQVPEGRQLFGPLTVEENLELGAYARRGRHRGGKTYAYKLAEVFSLFPRLEERRRQEAGTLSGGEQQMLAVGRALMAEPRVLLLDEPSMGLAPLLVKEIFTTLRRLSEGGLTMILVEQDARIALSLAHRGLVMERGSVVLEDSAASLLKNPEVQVIYFGQKPGRKVMSTTPE